MTQSRIDEARKYLGLNEKDNADKLRELTGVNVIENSWCAAFVSAIEEKIAGKKPEGVTLAARSYLKYGTAIKHPQPGDIVVFWRNRPDSWEGHVGYFVNSAGGLITVLGGNQNNSVCYKEYPESRVLGYRRSL